MSSRSRLTRPKSIATVVVVLSGVRDRSSTSLLTWVITASVVSGTISDTDPTNVVLPTPKPPPTMILTEVMPGGAPGLELAKSTENPFQRLEARRPLSEGRRVRRAFGCRVREPLSGSRGRREGWARRGPAAPHASYRSRGGASSRRPSGGFLVRVLWAVAVRGHM